VNDCLQMKVIALVMTLISLRAAVAALALVSPGDGEVVVRLPDPQRTVMLLETYDERLEWCRNHGSSDGWRKSQPLVLKWRATADEKGPWRISVGKSADLSGAQIWYLALSRNVRTPQYRQAMEVMRLVDVRNEAEVRYRNLVWAWKMLRLHGLDKKGAADVRAFIESRPERERKVGYFKHLPEWVEWWPRRAELLDNLERQMREIERVAQPVAHTWSLIRSDEQQEDHGNIGL